MRWIGGGSGAGKSAVATSLAERFGLRVYHVEPLTRFLALTTPKTAPMLHAFAGMSMDERWVSRTPREMYDTFHAFHGECFDLLLAEVLELPDDRLLIVEGFSLLPRLVVPLLDQPSQAIWLLPTSAFRRWAFDTRDTTWKIPSRTSDPEQALENLLARDALFTEQLARDAVALSAQTLTVDGRLTLDQTMERVAAALALPH